MKKKLLIGIITIFVLSCLYKVQAYTGELDPENYITLPTRISVENGKGVGTVSISDSAKGYNISYQKVDITESKFNSLQNKSKEISNYLATVNKNAKEKEENLETLKKEYEKLQSSGTATTEQITAIQTKYNEAYKNYEDYYKAENKKISTMQNEFNAMLPNYTNSWTKTTNSSDNIQLDFDNYSGKIYFTLWVKIENGSKTYYDMNIYSSNIQQEENNENVSTNGEWTDFSKAKFELKKDGMSSAKVEISNIKPKSDSTYYMFITPNNSKTNVNKNSNEAIALHKNSGLETTDVKVAKYVELNQDLYATILEVDANGKENVVIYGKRLERYAEPKYADAFNLTFISHTGTQIITTLTHEQGNNRKIQIKIGKITDTSILQKIKKQDSSGFASLMSFAKSNNGIYNQTVEARKDFYQIEYNNKIDLKGLQDGAYYYLYIKADGENGKYTSPEMVTLAQAITKQSDNWALFFYGSSDFKWANFENISSNNSANKDNTVVKGNLPKTGISIAMFIAFGFTLIGGGAFSYIQYRKNNF